MANVVMFVGLARHACLVREHQDEEESTRLASLVRKEEESRAIWFARI